MDDSKRVLAEKRRTTRQEVKEDRAQAVDIGGGIELAGVTLSLFGRNVPRRPENRQCSRQVARRVEPFGEAEVADQRLGAAVEQDITRFQITMKNALAMGVLHRTGRFGQY